MSRLEGSWELTRNGEVVASGNIGSLAIPPQKAEQVTLGYSIPSDGRCYLKISFASYGNDYIPNGEIVGFTQFELPTEPIIEETLSFGTVCFEESNRSVTVFSDNFEYVYSKDECAFSSLKLNGKELLKLGMRFNVFRALLDNDSRVKASWLQAKINCQKTYGYDTKVSTYDGYITLTSTACISANCLDPILKIKVEWTVFANGRIDMHTEVQKGDGLTFKPINIDELDNQYFDIFLFFKIRGRHDKERRCIAQVQAQKRKCLSTYILYACCFVYQNHRPLLCRLYTIKITSDIISIGIITYNQGFGAKNDNTTVITIQGIKSGFITSLYLSFIKNCNSMTKSEIIIG